MDAEAALRVVAGHYQGSRFNVQEDKDIVGKYRLQLVDKSADESYLLSIFAAGWINISSSSPCFTAPEGVYPGGDF